MFDIKSHGFNINKINDNNYEFIPFLDNNLAIYLNCNECAFLHFDYLYEGIVNETIIKTKGKNYLLTNNFNNININTINNYIIKIYPNIVNKDCKIILANINIDKNQNNLENQSNSNSFIIVTAKWGIKIAESLSLLLNKLNFNTIIINNKISDKMITINKNKPNEYFIILFSHLLKKLPATNKYIIYQLEQKKKSNFITEKVLENILNSLFTLDYSLDNINNFNKEIQQKISYLPMPIINKLDSTITTNTNIYDLLFYGHINHRRQQILDKLKEKYNILIIENKFGDEMYNIIKKSKIIINLHAYMNSILETARINEVLPYNKLIISELPCNSDIINKKFYENKIVFCEQIYNDLNNITNLFDQIDYYLKPDNYNNFIVHNKNNIENIYNNSLNYLTLYFKKFTNNNKLNNKLNDNMNLNNENENENDNYVFIITNNTGGGSIKYLDDITKYYKNPTFIYINSSNQFNKYKINNNSILFLQHLFDTDIELNFIFELKKKYLCKLIISIHDFYWIDTKLKYSFNNPTSWEYNYLKTDLIIHDDIINIFKIADDIIHPSQFTYNIYSKYFSTNNFKLILHNDYKIDYSTKYIPKIIANTINIGVLHSYSIYKGSEYINKLKLKYTKYSNYIINWLIVGQNIPLYNEIEFYDYVKKYNLHCLTYLNKWGETWCYSLTKAINSGLPIIYNNFGAFKERIPSNIEHYFLVYENENETESKSETDINKLYNIFEKMLEYIIDNNGKFNKYVDNKKIIYNEYYDKLFFNQINLIDKFALSNGIDIEYKDVILITSKIIVSNNVLSYTNNRSIYTTDERFNQTIKTIESIKKYLPNAYIILFDNSKIDINKINILNSSVNLFINLIDNSELEYYTNEFPNKGYGELMQTKYALKYIKNLNIKQFFKISGRYLINNTFNYKDYDNVFNIFKKNSSVTDRKYYYTSFYKISANNFNEYYNTINSLCEYIKNNRSYDKIDHEVYLPKNISNFIKITNLGITQNIAIWNQCDNI